MSYRKPVLAVASPCELGDHSAQVPIRLSVVDVPRPAHRELAVDAVCVPVVDAHADCWDIR